MASNKRRLNVPEVCEPGDLWQDCLWDVFGEVYPEVCAGSIEIATAEDPFSAGRDTREMYHATVVVHGLGCLDLGWAIRGEPWPSPPVINVVLDGYFMSGLAHGFATMPREGYIAGQGRLNKEWNGLVLLAKTTLLGLGVFMVENYKDHPAVRGFRGAAAESIRSETGMLRRWPVFSDFDLEEMDFVE